MRYEIQGSLLSDTLRGSKVRPCWVAFERALTVRGARRVWWRHVNRVSVSPMTYRIYDTRRKRVVES